MKAFIPILVGLWISPLFLVGCSMNRADSLRMLDKRADYVDEENPNSHPDPALKEAGLDGFASGPVPVRTRPKVASIWIHPHEMPSHDYFWGGWMSAVVEADQWVLSQPGALPSAPGILDAASASGYQKKAKVRIPGAKPRLKSISKQEGK